MSNEAQRLRDHHNRTGGLSLLNRKRFLAAVAAAAAVSSSVIWFGGWFVYDQISVWQTIKNAAFQQLLLGAIAVTVSGCFFFGWRGLPQSDTPKPPKMMRTKEQETFNVVEQKIQEMTELAGDTTETESMMEGESFLSNQLKRYSPEPEPEPMLTATEVASKTKQKPTASHKDVYSENKVRLHNAMVNAMIRDIDNGELKVVPSKETIEKLGLSDLKITLEEKKTEEKKPAPPPKLTTPATKLTRSA